MGGYVRPSVESVEFRDDDGNIIDYGNRWASRGGIPPEDSYSVDGHPERFAPLHTIAAALIDYLVSTYEVDVEEGPHVTTRSEEHTSELQSRGHLVCRLLLEKKKTRQKH